MHQFKDGTPVYTLDGQEIGQVERVVLDPGSKEVTHVVVRKGLLFKTDKLVPVELVDVANEDHVMLNRDADNLPELSNFEETHYVHLSNQEKMQNVYPPENARPVYWYPAATGMWGYPAPGFASPDATQIKARPIPEETVPLKEGAKVISADGEHVGQVKQVFTDPETDRATHFIISQGLLLKEEKVVPTSWTGTVGEDQVELVVGSNLLEELPNYR